MENRDLSDRSLYQGVKVYFKHTSGSGSFSFRLGTLKEMSGATTTVTFALSERLAMVEGWRSWKDEATARGITYN